MTEPININVKQLQDASELPSDKKYYFNGFAVAISPMDCVIVLLHNNQPIALLSTSHTIAKTLATQLNGLIEDLEKKTQQRILRLDEIQALLDKDSP